MTLMAGSGHGLFGSPGLEGHRSGLDGSPIFTTVDVQHNGQSLTLISEDEVARLRLPSELHLDVSGVLQLRHGLTHLTDSAWQVNRLAVTLPVAEHARHLLAVH